MHKQELVKEVFDKVAKRYDLMNDLMSFGMHRNWKKRLINEVNELPQRFLLDLAGGTGDVAYSFIENGGERAIVCDINNQMLNAGLFRSINSNKWKLPVSWVCGDAQKLPFSDYTFDYCTISFGIRNVSNIELALAEILRVLKPGGKFVCLEFINPKSNSLHVEKSNLIEKLYDWYSFNAIPKIGQLVVGDSSPYQYLVESIRDFPLHNLFINMLETTGFYKVAAKTLSFGIVGLYSGYKVT